MKIDLEQLYYGATAFLVFLVAFSAAQTLADSVLRLIMVSSVPLEERQQSLPIPAPTLMPPATTAPLVAPGQPTPIPEATLTPEQREAMQRKERARMEDFELRGVKEGVAWSLAILLIALPIWWFHWQRWRALTQTESAFFFLHIYSVMLITLILAVVRSGGAVGAIIQWLLGVADTSTRYSALAPAQNLVGNTLGALIALIAWGYHWRSVREEREEKR